MSIISRKRYFIYFLTSLIFFTCIGLASATARDVAPSGAPYTDIASALAASSSGDSVHVHAGTYPISSPLIVKSGVTLYGDGASSTIIKMDSRDHFKTDSSPGAILLSGASNVEIYGFTINGGESSLSVMHSLSNSYRDFCQGVAVKSGSSNIVIHDMFFTLAMGDSIHGWSNGGSNVIIYNCVMDTPGHDGIDDWNGDNWLVNNIKVNEFINSGIKVASASNFTITNSTFYCDTGSGYTGVEIMESGNSITINHCVFGPANNDGDGIMTDSADGSVGGTCNVSYNIFYGLSGTAIGHTGSYSITVTQSGNQYPTSLADWASQGYGYNASNSNAGNGGTMSVYNGTPAPSLTSPANGPYINSTNGKVTLEWNNLNSTKYELQVANDSGFTDMVLDTNVTGSPAAPNQYKLSVNNDSSLHWRIRAMNDVTSQWTNYTTQWDFTVNGNDIVVATTGVWGVISDAVSAEPILGAVVTLTNGSYSATNVTTADGYYVFSVDQGTGVYTLTVQATGYASTPVMMPFNMNNTYIHEDIALTALPSYFAPHNVTITVTDIMGQRFSGVTVSLYSPDNPKSNGKPDFTSKTDDNGNVIFSLNPTTTYTVWLNDSTQNVDQTYTLNPGDTQYNYWVWGATKKNNNNGVPQTQNIDDYIKCVVKDDSAVNLTNQYVNVTIYPVSGNISSNWNITLNQVYSNNGTIVNGYSIFVSNTTLLSSSLFYSGSYNSTNGVITVVFPVPNNNTYLVTAWVSNPNYDSGNMHYFFAKEDLQGNPIRNGYQLFGWTEQWQFTILGYALMLMMGGLIGRSSLNAGVLSVMCIGLFNWYTGWIQYSTGDQIMATLGCLLVIVYIFTKKY